MTQLRNKAAAALEALAAALRVDDKVQMQVNINRAQTRKDVNEIASTEFFKKLQASKT